MISVTKEPNEDRARCDGCNVRPRNAIIVKVATDVDLGEDIDLFLCQVCMSRLYNAVIGYYRK
jgi:hypothetical protein